MGTRSRRLGSVLVAMLLAAGCGMRATAGGGSGTTEGTGGGAGTTESAGDGPGTTESSGNSTTTDGCADLFNDGEFSCRSSHAESCAFLAERPNRVADWYMKLVEDLGDVGQPEDKISEFERKAACVEEYLDGVGVEHGPIEDEDIFAVASYAEVEPLCKASMIEGCAPEAMEGECEAYDEADCEETPWCRCQRGQRIEPGASCHVTDLFGMCIPESLSCGMAPPATASGPDGACWLFSDPCEGEGGPAWDWNPPDCPDVAEWDAIPECG